MSIDAARMGDTSVWLKAECRSTAPTHPGASATGRARPRSTSDLAVTATMVVVAPCRMAVPKPRVIQTQTLADARALIIDTRTLVRLIERRS